MIPTWLQAVILGLVQGATEFIPVSSSGHLVLVPFLFGWERPGLAFDVALHGGTAGAIVVYFRQELLGMLRAVAGRGEARERRLYRRLAVLLALASVPVAVAGLLFRDSFERAFESPPMAASFLLVTAVVLVTGERVRGRRVRRSTAARSLRPRTGSDTGERRGLPSGPAARDEAPAVPVGADPDDPRGADLDHLTIRHAMVVGVAQILALFPGMSRSGTTITAGVVAGLARPAATRFSFLLALPALVGAMVLSTPDLAAPGPYSGLDIALGVTASFVAGYAAIAFLVQLVARVGLDVFAGYLVLAAAVGWGAWALTG